MVVWENGAHEKIGLPQVHHSRRMGQRRFRQHARNRRAPLPPRAGRKKADARPDSDRRRTRTTCTPRRKPWRNWKSSISPSRPSPSRRKFSSCWGRRTNRFACRTHSPLLHLIQQIRDETHRFAVTFHRQRRSRRTLAPSWTIFPASARAPCRSCCANSAAWRSVRLRQRRGTVARCVASAGRAHRRTPARQPSRAGPVRRQSRRLAGSAFADSAPSKYPRLSFVASN